MCITPHCLQKRDREIRKNKKNRVKMKLKVILNYRAVIFMNESNKHRVRAVIFMNESNTEPP